jgi:hypothetical protein
VKKRTQIPLACGFLQMRMQLKKLQAMAAEFSSDQLLATAKEYGGSRIVLP